MQAPPPPLPATTRTPCARWSARARCTATSYIDEEVFQLEMEHLFANTWVYAGHASQAPRTRRFHHPARSAASRC